MSFLKATVDLAFTSGEPGPNAPAANLVSHFQLPTNGFMNASSSFDGAGFGAAAAAGAAGGAAAGAAAGFAAAGAGAGAAAAGAAGFAAGAWAEAVPAAAASRTDANAN